MKNLFLHQRIQKLYLLLLLCFPVLVLAQNDHKSVQSVLTVVQDLSSRYNCNFTYLDTDLKDLTVVPPKHTLTLKETIGYLKSQTNLTFTIIDATNIAISLKKMVYCGKIINQWSGKPIENARIQYQKKEIYSDQNGNFLIYENLLPTSMQIQMLGYQEKKITITTSNNQACSTVALVPLVEELNPAIIRNYLTKGITQNPDGSIEINYNDFGLLPGLIEPDVLQTLQALPGIQSINESVTDLNIRGGTNDQNLLLWNGIKMYQSGHFFGLISAFNPYLTEKASVLKNGTSARYGESVSGTISIQTSDSIPTKIKAGMGTNMINADAFINTPLGKHFGLQVAARKSFSELLETPTYKNYFDKAFQNTEVQEADNTVLNSDKIFSFYDVSAQLLYTPNSRDFFKTNLLLIENNLVFKENGVFESAALSRESGAAQRSFSGSALYKRTWNEKWHTQMQLYATQYSLEAENADIENQQRLLQRNDVLETAFKLQNTTKISKNIALIGGYQFTETGITNLQDVTNPVVKSDIKEVLRSHSLFLESTFANKHKKQHSSITLGGRVQYIEKFNRFLLEPRFHIKQQFWKSFSLLLAGELKSQTTSQIINIQNDFLGIENRRWQLANDENVPIIQSKQASIGLQFKKNGWLLSAEGYVKKVTHITTQSQGFQNQFQSTITNGSYRTQGGDFLIYKAIRDLNIWASYTYATNDYEFSALVPPEFPNNIDVRHNVSFGTTYSIDNFKISTGLNWHTGKPDTRPMVPEAIINNAVNFENPNQSKLKDFVRFDASLTYGLQLKNNTRCLFGVSVWNYTNKTNVYNRFYRSLDEKLINTEQNALRLTPNATIRLFFD